VPSRRARFEGGFQFGAVEIFADEDETGDALFAFFPIALRIAFDDHVHALHDEALRLIREGKDAFEAQYVRAACLSDVVQPRQQLVWADQFFSRERDAGDAARRHVIVMGVIMMMMVIVAMMVMAVIMIVVRTGVVAIVIRQEVWIDFGDAVEIKRAEAHDAIQGNVAALHLMQQGRRVDLTDRAFNRCEFVLRDEIDLVQQDHVREGDLLTRFFVVLQLLKHVLGIDDRDDGVELGFRADVGVDEEGLRDWRGLREAGGFHKDGVEAAFAFHQTFNDADEIATHGAANAAIVHFEHFFVSVDDKVVVDPDFAELIHNHGVLFAVLLGQDAVQQGGLARAQEACEHGNGNWLGHGP
jgi:hypothetical protein